jgi:hypothetical protein
MAPVSAGAETRTDARRALLARLVDHAALFPPASMSMADAIAEDARARTGADAWLLGRFVCPMSRLDELSEAYADGGDVLPLSVVLDGPFGDVGLLEGLDGRFRVESVESRLPPDADPGALTGAAGEVYLELPPDERLEARLDAVAAAGLRAKLRCGGERVPSPAGVGRFVRACRERGLALKATAGLHHPLPAAGDHGFLNLLAAAVFGDEEAALAETDPAAFGVAADAFAWRGRTASAEEVAGVRERLLVGFGSCSFRDPVDGLRALGMLA